MPGVSEERLVLVIERFEETEARMSVATDPKEIVKLSRDHAELKTVADKARQLLDARNGMDEVDAILDDKDADPDMKELAQEEKEELRGQIPVLEEEMQLLLLPKDEDDEANAVLEVRAGTGGDEAALFAGDLFRMYQRYAQIQGWSLDVESVAEGEVGGYKEVIASVSGRGVFGKLKFESGVHRVQRVPKTESGGRIHTSAASVAVLPAPEEVNIEVRQEDIRVDTMRSSGAGGQHVNTTDSAVRMTHIPTGIVVTSSEKSQHQNRARAMEMLKIRLYEKERAEKDAQMADARKSQVGSGDRSEKIRTYNFPENRVSDHRIKLTLYKLEQILAGDALGEVVDALITEDQAARLAAMEEEG